MESSLLPFFKHLLTTLSLILPLPSFSLFLFPLPSFHSAPLLYLLLSPLSFFPSNSTLSLTSYLFSPILFLLSTPISVSRSGKMRFQSSEASIFTKQCEITRHTVEPSSFLPTPLIFLSYPLPTCPSGNQYLCRLEDLFLSEGVLYIYVLKRTRTINIILISELCVCEREKWDSETEPLFQAVESFFLSFFL